jgi:hypothetical protein
MRRPRRGGPDGVPEGMDMSLKGRLERLEHAVLRPGLHAVVVTWQEDEGTTIRTSGCVCRDAICPHHPELRIVLHWDPEERKENAS